MTLPKFGPLTITDIRREFGGAAPDGLTEYYAGGTYVPAGTTGINGPIPSSGQLDVSDFYGAPVPKAVDFTVSMASIYQEITLPSGTKDWRVIPSTAVWSTRSTSEHDSSGARPCHFGSITPAVDFTDPDGIMPVFMRGNIQRVGATSTRYWRCPGGLKPLHSRNGNYYCLPTTAYEESGLLHNVWVDRSPARGSTVVNPQQATRGSSASGGTTEPFFTLDLYAPAGSPILTKGVWVKITNASGDEAILPGVLPSVGTRTTTTCLAGKVPGTKMQVATFQWSGDVLGNVFNQYKMATQYTIHIEAV